MSEKDPIMPILMSDGEDSPSKEGFVLSNRSIKAMKDIHPDLRKVVELAITLTTHDFVITQGRRTIQQQREYVNEGKSQTMHSRHLVGCAVDYVDYPEFSYDLKTMGVIAQAFKEAAKQLNIPIHWGGDWKHFVDSSHIELDSDKYPD